MSSFDSDVEKRRSSASEFRERRHRTAFDLWHLRPGGNIASVLATGQVVFLLHRISVTDFYIALMMLVAPLRRMRRSIRCVYFGENCNSFHRRLFSVIVFHYGGARH